MRVVALGTSRPASGALGARVVAVLAVALLAPLPVAAQDTTTVAAPPAESSESGDRTHTVREGDTLWEIAHSYFGDPFLWPEIYRVNTEVVEDPHWIYPGEVLLIPSGIGAPTGTTPVAEGIQGPEAVETPVVPVATAAEGAPLQTSGRTVFAAERPRSVVSTDRRETERQTRPIVRLGEVLAAPYADREGGPRQHGRIVATADASVIRGAEDMPRLQLHDRVFVVPPRGGVAAGEELLAYELGPVIIGIGQIVLPTGVIRIIEPRAAEVAVGEVVAIFRKLRVEQPLVRVEAPLIPVGVQAQPVEPGRPGKVVWIADEPVVPSILQYVVIDPAERQGIRIGDQYTLAKPRRELESGVTLPAIPVATVQVVRVTSRAVTAVLIDVEQPAIAEGLPARLTARMP